MSHATESEPAKGRVITWHILVRLEPRLLALYCEARAIKDDKRKSGFCANAAWYGHHGFEGLKDRLIALVGWGRRNDDCDPRLRTSEAYDVAYHTVYEALPDCRGCSCVAWDGYITDVLRSRGIRR